jgi:cellulose synthase/poly-beta-1,6-N-acetylglucosamine synthase-like glycosyltransferase
LGAFLFLGVCTAIILYLYDSDIRSYIKAWEKISEGQVSHDKSSHPLISVLVPFRNEKLHLPGLISQLKIQDYPRYEVILINDHSQDQPEECLDSHLSSKVRMVVNSGEGKKEALETGLSFAKGELILFTDADTQHRADWISTMRQYLHSSERSMVTGPVLGRAGRGIFSKYFYLDMIGLMVITASAIKGRLHPMANGANMMVRRAHLPQKDPFQKMDSPSGDDLFLASLAFQDDQLDFCLKKEAVVTTKGPGGLNALIRQRHRWASKNSKIKSPQMERTLKHYSALYLLLGGLLAYALLAPFWGILLFAVAYILKSRSDLALIRKGCEWLDQKISFKDILQVQWINILVHWGAGIRMALGQPIIWKKRSY